MAHEQGRDKFLVSVLVVEKVVEKFGVLCNNVIYEHNYNKND